MKNLLNFKRLLSYSHEKQSPQRFFRYAAMLIMLLTLGVGQMWATTVYYVNRNSWSGVKIHYWGGTGGSSWDSRPLMTKTGYKVNGFDVYSYNIGNNNTLIFMDSSNDSNRDGGDVSFSDSSKPYYFGGWYASWAACWQVKGSYDSWAGTTCTSTGNNTGRATVSLSADTEFKLYCLANSNWYGSNGGTIPDNTSWTLNGSKNTSLAHTHDGNYVFDIDFSGSNPSVKTHTPYQVSYAAGTGATGDVSASAITTYGSTCTLSSSTFSKAGYTQDGWATSEGGSKAYNLGASYTGGYTDVTLYPHWAENTFDVTVNDDGHGSTSPSGKQSSVGQITGIAISADPGDDYEFVNWTIESGTGSFEDATDESTTFYPTSAATIQANFRSTVTNSLTVAAGTHVGTVTGSTDPVTLGNSYAISASNFDPGYEFYNWTASPVANATFVNASSASTNVTVNNGSVTVTANARERMSTLTTSNSYNAGDPRYAIPTKSASSIGISTTATLTATTPSTGYTFAGWTLSDNIVVTGGDKDNDLSITVRTNGNGAEATAQANYEEVLTSRWHLVGANLASKVTYPDGWNVSNISMMQKATGHSTESVVYANVTVSNADGTYEFKVVDDNGASDDIWYGYSTGGTYLTWTGTSTKNVYSGDGNSNNLKFTPTVAGTYVFKVDYSGTYPAVTITYPVSYTLTYGIGTVKGNNGSISTSPTTASGSKVLSGNTVTLTAPDAADGYTWKGWYLNSDGSDEQQEDDQEYAVTVSSDKTLYACYTEDMHDVTVNAQTGGTVSYDGGAAGSSCTARAGIATASANIVATASDGYYFAGWLLPDGTITKATESAYNGATSTYTINATADSKTVTALFNVRYALLGSPDPDDKSGNPEGGMPGWGEVHEAPFTYSAGTSTYTKTVDLTKSNVNYKFRIVDRRGATHTSYGLLSKAVIAADGNYHDVASTANDAQLATAGVGTYTLTVQTIAAGDNAGKPQVKITNPASHLITMGTLTDHGDGGSVSAVDGEATPNPIVSGNYIKDGGDIVVTAEENTGYTFVGWYSDASCTIELDDDEDAVDLTYTKTNLGGALAVYAKFTENKTTVTVEANNAHGTVTIAEGAGRTDETHASVGVYTTASVTAVPDAGYYFAGWTLSNETFTASGTGEANTTITITGAGTAGTSGTLTANFVELDKIYFRNIFDDGAGNVSRWSDVYVHFDIDWADYSGQQAVKTSANNIAKGLHVAMTQIGSSDVYWAYVPRYITANSKTKVAFADHEDTYNDSYLWEGQASGRGDYSPLLNMFVPYHSAKKTGVNGVDYYDNGYWMRYDTRASQGAGYYLKVYNSRNNYTQKGEFLANTDDATAIQFQVRIDNTGEAYTRFMIVSAGGLNYLATATPTSTANSDIDLKEDTRAVEDYDVYFQLTATSEGFYTFILDQTGDKMKLTVDYPVSPGDYRLKHTYTGRNKANDADSTYTTYSDVIKSSNAANATTLSMYLNSASTSLVLQRCSEINSTTKLPTWSTGDATNLSAITTAVGTNSGVYQFDVTVDTSTDQVSAVNNIGLYTGNYYIKTDCAPGGWVNYTQNAMEANTINATAAGYDYYFLKWIDNTKTNVKCIIANDYCNELSDTLYSDAILTRNGKAYQTLPEAASVRFSYDSKTNTLKRTYLRGSTLSENFVTLVPNAAEYVYSEETSGTDYHSSNPKFADNGNWTYQMDAWVYPGAKGGVQTSYPGAAPVTTQILVPMDNDLMGGTKPVSDPVRYHVRLVYDFKTDYLMAAYIPDATTPITTEIDLQSDMMYVRSGVSNGTQLSFDENNGKLTNVRRAYAAIQLPKDEMVGQMTTWSANDYRAYKYCRYYISFPFDVNVRDIFGVGTFGNEYIIKMYNGAKRAQIGWFAETETFWETLTIDSVLHAYQGYCLMLDRNAFNDASNGVWTNIGSGGSTFLYFPSSSTTIGEINGDGGIIQVPTHTCTIDRTFGSPEKNHKNTDSNWNLMGFAPYADAEKTGETLAYYVYEPEGNSWTSANTSETNNFNSMHAYMVQWGGNFNYIQAPDVPSSVAARRVKAQKKNDFIRLELLYNGAEADHASIKMTDGADKDFVLNEDMGKIINSGKPNIYVYAGNYDVAFSQVPEESQTVQVGVVIRKNGTYTFSMPSNFDGTVTLIDNFTQTRTNLALGDYEVSLPKGEINDRFLLEINIRQVPTAIDGVEGGSLKDGKAHKFIENGVMYILRDGQIYDARGNKVK